tara:strand:+ start:1556 stop:1711 length:156 start_codon:yes stop_codon:yes gene_type:complete
MSYIKGTHLEALIDRTVDGWAKLLGFVEDEPKTTAKTTKKKVTNTKKKVKK